jgi:hypothetical protein
MREIRTFHILIKKKKEKKKEQLSARMGGMCMAVAIYLKGNMFLFVPYSQKQIERKLKKKKESYVQ